MTLCAAPVPAPEAHEISDRRISVTVAIHWGDGRDQHEKTLEFCSFGCAARYFIERGLQHDQRTVPA